MHDRLNYEKLFEIDRAISTKTITDVNKKELVDKLNIIEQETMMERVPIGCESNYFQMLYAIEILRHKLGKLI